MMRAVTTTPVRDPDEVARFVERFALVLVEAGMPRMPSRVFAALLSAEDGKLTAGELADSLKVSPAAISGAVRYLTQVSLAFRGRDPGERRDHYEVAEDTWYMVYANREKMFETWSSLMADGVEAVGRGSKAGHRLETTRQFFDFLKSELPKVIERWQEHQARLASG
jgi:DNA-binding transcriptional regulator GbsR (MarR family)